MSEIKAELGGISERQEHLDKCVDDLKQKLFGDGTASEDGGRLGKIELRQNQSDRRIERLAIGMTIIVVLSNFLGSAGTVSLKSLMGWFK